MATFPGICISPTDPERRDGASKLTIAADGMSWPAVDRARRAGVSFSVSAAPMPTSSSSRLQDLKPSKIQRRDRFRCHHAGRTGQDPGADRVVRRGSPIGWSARAPRLVDRRRSHAEPSPHPRQDVRHGVCPRLRPAVAGLQALAPASRPSDWSATRWVLQAGHGVRVFGQGSQWAGMVRQLRPMSRFAAAVDELESLLVKTSGFRCSRY